MSTDKVGYSEYSWNNNSNKSNNIGINPPFDKIIPVPSNNYTDKLAPVPKRSLLSTGLLSNISNKDYPIISIKSNREPYAVEHLFTKYGDLNMRVGTNIGFMQQ